MRAFFPRAAAPFRQTRRRFVYAPRRSTPVPAPALSLRQQMQRRRRQQQARLNRVNNGGGTFAAGDKIRALLSPTRCRENIADRAARQPCGRC